MKLFLSLQTMIIEERRTDQVLLNIKLTNMNTHEWRLNAYTVTSNTLNEMYAL